jgi:hypothetical protein
VEKINSHLTIDGHGVPHDQFPTAHAYERAVANLYHKIGHSHTGRAVLESIAHSHQKILVTPYTTADANAHGTFNAFAQQENTRSDPRFAGHNAHIHYSPTTWNRFLLNQHGHDVAGAHPDEVLLHETTHALREDDGTFNPRALDHAYDTEEEFFAILVANIYASELGRLHDLRADHHSHHEISANQDTSAEFLPRLDPNDYKYRLIKKFVDEEPKLTHKLAHVRASFNPIRRYFHLLHHGHHHHHHHGNGHQHHHMPPRMTREALGIPPRRC